MKTLRRLVFLGGVLLAASCGLPDTYYLQPPAQGTVTTGVSFQFTNPIHDLNHDINVTFSGNELYYKFYADQYVEDNAYDASNPQDSAAQLVAKGFSRVCLSTDQNGSYSDPLIPIGTALAQAGSSVVVSIARVGPQSSYVLEGGPAVEIRRYALQDDSVHLKTFNATPPPDNYRASDSDIGFTLYLQLGNNFQIYVAMYAISYGEILGTQAPVRSEAVFLGSLNFIFP